MARSLDSGPDAGREPGPALPRRRARADERGRPGKDFTVQEVVERSGQSLRSFYQYFGGKHELLLALFEESVRSTAEHLEQKIAEEDDPLERLHRFVVEYYRMCRPNKVPTRRQPVDGKPSGAKPARAGHGRLRPEAADRLPDRGGRRLRPARVRCSARCSTTPPRPVPSAPACATARSPASCSRRSCSTPSRSTIGGVPCHDAGDPAEELWDLVLHGIGSAPSAERGP